MIGTNRQGDALMKYELLSTERRISWKQVIIAALIWDCRL